MQFPVDEVTAIDSKTVKVTIGAESEIISRESLDDYAARKLLSNPTRARRLPRVAVERFFKAANEAGDKKRLLLALQGLCSHSFSDQAAVADFLSSQSQTEMLREVFKEVLAAPKEYAIPEMLVPRLFVAGVSGSGKSTLIAETLYPILNHHFFRAKKKSMPFAAIEGLEHIDKVIEIDQTPIGRTPRSNPSTYTGVFSDIRNLFVALPEAKIRGYKPGRFSFNVKGGRCETCQGAGLKIIEMNFLPDVQVPCEECGGKRYNRETLEVRYRGKSISDVLNMSVEEAVPFFESIPAIYRKIKTLQDVGLGYITLGQSSTTLSGGEAQRVKLATELSKKDTGNTFYILDEPTTGLHFEDIHVLLGVLNRLVDHGNTVLIIEHNLDVVKVADWVLDLGPEGGSGGGEILFEGTPEGLAACAKSHTGKYLKAELKIK
jgi:excinuclease ABC subunit A